MTSRGSIEDEDDDEYENVSPDGKRRLGFQPNRTEGLETDLGVGESLRREFEPDS
jgi:hypothetical protein